MRLAERLIRRFGVSDEEVEKRIKVYNNGYDEGYKQAMIDIQPIIKRLWRKKGGTKQL